MTGGPDRSLGLRRAVGGLVQDDDEVLERGALGEEPRGAGLARLLLDPRDPRGRSGSPRAGRACAAWIRRIASMPSRSGIDRSIRTRSASPPPRRAPPRRRRRPRRRPRCRAPGSAPTSRRGGTRGGRRPRGCARLVPSPGNRPSRDVSAETARYPRASLPRPSATTPRIGGNAGGPSGLTAEPRASGEFPASTHPQAACDRRTVETFCWVGPERASGDDGPRARRTAVSGAGDILTPVGRSEGARERAPPGRSTCLGGRTGSADPRGCCDT